MKASLNSSIQTAAWLAAFLLAPAAGAQTVFQEDFEWGWNGWNAGNGVWDVGAPTVGPGAYGGQWCAGTNLGGNYPDLMNTRLESPSIALPSLSSGELLLLKFWYWQQVELKNYNGIDWGEVQVLEQGGTWQNVGATLRATSPVWTQGCLDLSAHAGKTIKLGFHAGSGNGYTALGWYVDDVSIERGPPELRNPENFEAGAGDWDASNGVWQIGIPTAGPGSTPSGSRCAGTHLEGGYWDYGSTRLSSPHVDVLPDSADSPQLRFQHWFDFDTRNYNGTDYGTLQIRDVNAGTWTDLATYRNSGSDWTRVTVDLSAYTGLTVQIGFLLTTGGGYTDSGWYVDNFEVTGISGHRGVRFTEFGQGLAGSGGYVPVLQGRDDSSIGEYQVRISGGLGGAAGWLAVATSQVDAPAFDGRWYVGPQTFFLLPVRLLGSDGVAGAGFLNYRGEDLSPYPGLTLYLQTAIADPGAPRGIALTQALQLDVEQ